MNKSNKLKVLCWSDNSLAGTGFGIVSRHVLTSLHNTGKYEIHHLAINHHGEFHDSNKVPWQVQPARLLDPKDPHGLKMFARTLAKNNYDIVWVLNDLHVSHKVAGIINKVKQAAISAGRRPPVFIHYFPVDCQVTNHIADFLNVCDVPVCYTNHGKEETLKTKPELEKKLITIPHGVDTKIFFPSKKEHTEKWRQDLFRCDPDTTLILNVNRNSQRKQIPYSMLAFKEFRKHVPNSKMYIHTVIKDQGGDMQRAVEHLGFSMSEDIIFPVKFSPSNPAPDAVMHQIYNCADIFLTTHIGEGWGLSITEAMACGLPVITGNNTCMPEHFGTNSERGYMYKCKDTLWIDSSGYRKKGLIPDIVDKMLEAHAAGPKENNSKCHKAIEYARQHDWRIVNQKWIQLFQQIEEKFNNNSIPTVIEEI